MIGYALPLFRSADLGGRANAVENRHLQIHQHHVEASPLDRSTASRPLLTIVHVMATVSQHCARHFLVHRIVLGDQHVTDSHVRRWRRRRIAAHSPAPAPCEKPMREVEFAASARHAVDVELAAHHLDEPARDGRARARCRRSLRVVRSVGLPERLEDAPAGSGAMPMPVSRTAKCTVARLPVVRAERRRATR